MHKLKIFSYNIHKGFSGAPRVYTLNRMREEIKKLHPDIIFLQEVQGHHGRKKKRIKSWPDVSQFEYLAGNLWPYFSYGKNAVYAHGHHGNALLSKFPILSSENIDISKNRFESRGLLHATIQLPGNLPSFHAICVHLGLLENDRRSQLKDLGQRIKKIVSPEDLLVVAGDFNDWRENASSHLVKTLNVREAFKATHGEYAKSFPSFYPLLRLDRIYCRGFKIQSARCLIKSPWNRLSDHNPLEAELSILKKNLSEK